LPLIKELYDLDCFVGFIDSKEAKEKLLRISKENRAGTFICRTGTRGGPRSFVFCVGVDAELRQKLALQGEVDKAEPIYEYQALPLSNGLYKICGKETRLADIPKTFSYLFKTPYSKYTNTNTK